MRLADVAERVRASRFLRGRQGADDFFARSQIGREGCSDSAKIVSRRDELCFSLLASVQLKSVFRFQYNGVASINNPPPSHA